MKKYKVTLRQNWTGLFVCIGTVGASDYVTADNYATILADQMPETKYNDGGGYGTKAAGWWAEVEEQDE